ncbi:uncharacterized protein A1O9_04601 [Exophiala aquamarina CBS 119918]|uniref:VPS9 domain-containing protein n=1 Tax=Exophiala aquamarina CBS 119918 TaxID=1182545 RepID=A0A072PKB9_9EURO|nr:uncharacterized protein A1O9_04601 [Exophiala aquamarina CBS 119918]KEF59753.1 hypothetical protein A1O9_04601 [Exophiala aquamarina CBS 119918]
MSATSSLKNRPSALSTKSFTRYEPSSPSNSTSRARASTTSSVSSLKSPKKVPSDREDVFQKPLNEDSEPPSPDLERANTLPDNFDELPIELASLSDRFVDSLKAKVYTEPPSVDQLSDLFQEFYARASGAIAIHISALKSRLNREHSPAPSKAASKSRTLSARQSSDSLKPRDSAGGSQQMLTASEVTEKRKQRKMLEYKRILLEEAVERRVCENIYDKIWRHKSTLDEVRDEKLRSKTAALALVGIGLKDLGIEVNADQEKSVEDVQASLIPAREGLAKMNDEKYPLGKLKHLTAAHKAIVDTLYTIHPSSSSADEILPTLIYTLITSPIEGINIISNLYFIQRFRAAPRIDGEAAYCLTNLEAAISFLENVDLASLRADEMPEGPKKNITQDDDETAEKLEAFPTLPGSVPFPSTPTTSTSPSTATASNVVASPTGSILKPLPEKPAPPVTRHQRTLSDILLPISNANEAVRSTAEEGFKNISSTLDNSFKFLLGRLKERGTEDANAEVIVPKTLDEARQLVNRPLTPEEDDNALSESSSVHDGQNTPSNPTLTKTEDKILSLLGGRKSTTVRERSVDSVQSNGSGRRLAFLQGNPDGAAAAPTSSRAASIPQPTSNNPLESVKSFGGSLNPINHIGSAFGGAFGRFGSRATASASPPSASTPAIVVDKDNKSPLADKFPKSASLSTPEDGATKTPMRIPNQDELSPIKAAPPVSRFMSVADVNDLKIGDVQLLLSDYQRLARILGQLVQRAEESADTDENTSEATASDQEKD